MNAPERTSLAVRAAIALLAVAAALGLGVHYDVAYDGQPLYPDGEMLLNGYDAHVGERTLLFGTVRSVSEEDDTARIRVSTDSGPLDLTVQGFDATVQPGGGVQVFGTVEPDRTIDAGTVAVVNPAGSSDVYKYAVSAVGGLLVLAQFFRHWRFDAGALAFEVRDRG